MKKNKQEITEISAAVAAHLHAVKKLLEGAVKAGHLTDNQLKSCLEHADGARWESEDHTHRPRPEAINVDVVWQTYDYNAFSLMDEGLNRKVDHWQKIVKSMARCPMSSPIIVNGDLQIIDGQNRFFARRFLGLPIEYIIKKDYGAVEARNYNTAHKNWSKGDYVASYSAEGKGDYVALEQLYTNYPKLPKAVIDTIATRGAAGSNSVTTIQDGQLQIHSFQECENICKMLMEYDVFQNHMNPSQKILNSSQWCRAWLTLYFNNPEFEPERLLRNARTMPSYIYPAGNVKATCEMLTKLYNRYSKSVATLKY